MNLFVSLSLTILLLSSAAVFALFPPSHNVKGKIQLVIEDVDISLEGWYDPKGHRSRVDYFDSATKSYQLPYENDLSMFYKFVPASDGDRNWTACHYGILDKKYFQPTIPFKIDRRNKTKDEVNGIQCTLYTNTRVDEVKVITLNKYWVRENGTSEIPMRYEFKKYSDRLVLKHYIIDYYDYKETLIPPVVFKVNETGYSCKYYKLNRYNFLNPMNIYVDIDSDTFRAEVIRHNLDFIDRHNNAGLDYKLGINKFIDWTHEEYLTLLNAKPLLSSIQNNHELYPSENDTVPAQQPEELDLRKQGFVTPVKNQLSTCGSCYAFCAAGALEGAYYKKYKTLPNLSEQAIVDCAWFEDNIGCLDGFPESVFLWARKHGVPASSDYYRKYSGIENYCVLSNQSFNVAVKEDREVQRNSTDALKQALVEYGPVAVIIDASPRTFQSYSDGVYTDPSCVSGDPGHCVLVVGYGIEEGKPYWLIKNSYGTTWGEKGYMKISQKNNLCGVLDYPIFPVVN